MIGALIFPVVGVVWLYYIGLVIYRLTLHPLARFPGPKLWAATQWPEAIQFAKGRWHLDVHEAHEKYGDVVRISPDHLSYRSTEAVHDIYENRRANVKKGGGFTEAAEQINRPTSIHSMSDRTVHAKRRRLVAHAFSESALRGWEPYIIQTTQKWIDTISPPTSQAAVKGEWDKPIDMGIWSSNLTVDVLGELCFGKSFNAIEEGKMWVTDLLLAGAKITGIVAFLPFREILYPIMRQNWLLSTFGTKMIRQKSALRAMLMPVLKARFQLEEDTKDKPELQRKDFMHYLVNATDPETGSKFTAPELIGETTTLVGAGTDTTSTALSAFFFYTTRIPRVAEKLRAEVRSAFTSVDEIKSGPTLSNLKYLRAVIDECLRVSSPVPDILHRRVLPGGATIDGQVIPSGAIVGTSAWVIHHNAKYFPKPFEFYPERWIAGSKDAPFEVTERSVEEARRAFVPFSLGTRNCVGKSMAIMEMLITIARVVMLTDVRKVEGPLGMIGEGGHTSEKGRERVGEFQIQNYFLAARQGPFVEFKRKAAVVA